MFSIGAPTQTNCQVCVIPFIHVLIPFPNSLVSQLKVVVDFQFVRNTRQFGNSPPYPVSLPSPQIFAYLAFATSSLLIVLRVYVFFLDAICKLETYGGKQNRHLGQENDHCCFRYWCMGD